MQLYTLFFNTFIKRLQTAAVVISLPIILAQLSTMMVKKKLDITIGERKIHLRLGCHHSRARYLHNQIIRQVKILANTAHTWHNSHGYKAERELL